MNSGKAVDRPTLQGQRIKTRKRDEKERTDPQAFRDSIIAAFSEILNSKSSPLTEEATSPTESVNNGTHKDIPLLSKSHLDHLSKFLDEKGSSKDCDYRIYGENLLDILLAGGLLGRVHYSCQCTHLSYSYSYSCLTLTLVLLLLLSYTRLTFVSHLSHTIEPNSTWRDNHHWPRSTETIQDWSLCLFMSSWWLRFDPWLCPSFHKTCPSVQVSWKDIGRGV